MRTKRFSTEEKDRIMAGAEGLESRSLYAYLQRTGVPRTTYLYWVKQSREDKRFRSMVRTEVERYLTEKSA